MNLYVDLAENDGIYHQDETGNIQLTGRNNSYLIMIQYEMYLNYENEDLVIMHETLSVVIMQCDVVKLHIIHHHKKHIHI